MGSCHLSQQQPKLLAHLLWLLFLCALCDHPRACTCAHTEQTRYPTLSYGLAEAKGDLFSTSNGIWGNAEFGYNPLNNNLGASVSTGTANSANTDGAERVGELGPSECAPGSVLRQPYVTMFWLNVHNGVAMYSKSIDSSQRGSVWTPRCCWQCADSGRLTTKWSLHEPLIIECCGAFVCFFFADRGASGVEFAGYSNDLTNLADARTDQSAQAIAYPYSILRPANTLTCTQVLTASCWSHLGAHVQSIGDPHTQQTRLSHTVCWLCFFAACRLLSLSGSAVCRHPDSVRPGSTCDTSAPREPTFNNPLLPHTLQLWDTG